MDISHDGKYLVAGSDDFSVSLFDLERGEKVNTYFCKGYGVDLVRFARFDKAVNVFRGLSARTLTASTRSTACFFQLGVLRKFTLRTIR